MKRTLLAAIIFCYAFPANCYCQNYGWTNIGDHLPDTISTATLTGIAMAGDSMWITSGYGTYLNQVPGQIYFSADRGNTFTIQNTLYGTHTIHMLDALRGWCGGVEGQVYYTADGGQTWERKYSASRTVTSISFPEGSDTGYCSGFTGMLKKLSLNGFTSVYTMGYVSNLYTVSCPDRHHVFACGGELILPYIYDSLHIDQSYPGTDGIYAIDMVDSVTGWCVGSPTAAGAWDSAGCMIIRTDDGHNWTEQVNPVKGKYGTLLAVKALNDQEAWAVGTSGVVIHTTDGGQNWVREAEGLTTEMLTGIWAVGPHEVYVVGNNRVLLKYGPSSGTSEAPQTSASLNIFPNPAGNFFRIGLLQPSAAHVKAELFDMAGRKLMSLFDKPMPAGNNDETISTGNLKNGSYLVKVTSGNQTMFSKIMIYK